MALMVLGECLKGGSWLCWWCVRAWGLYLTINNISIQIVSQQTRDVVDISGWPTGSKNVKICRLDESVWTLWWWPLVRLYIWTAALEAAASRSSTSQCTREGPINCSPSDRHAAGRSSHHADTWVQIVVRFTLQIIRKKYFARRCTCSKRKGIVWFQVPLSTLNVFPFIWGVHFSKRTSSHSSYWPGWSCWWIHTFLPMTSVIKGADLCALCV